MRVSETPNEGYGQKLLLVNTLRPFTHKFGGGMAQDYFTELVTEDADVVKKEWEKAWRELLRDYE